MRDGFTDAVYNDTFLITFKSFTTVDELFDLLVERFNFEQPAGLNPEERAQWIEKKQTPIRFRYAYRLLYLLLRV
jgi:son of sevenless